MNSLEQSAEQRRRLAGVEGREAGPETSKETGHEELEKLAAKERAEKVHRETKTAAKQLQNIMANMTAVVAAVAAIRQQLGLTGANSAIPSVDQDKKGAAILQKKLAKLRGELGDLSSALLEEELNAVGKEHPEWSPAEIKIAAAERVRNIMAKLGGVD